MPDVGTVLPPTPFAIDGGLASELEARGHDLHHRLWSARVLAEDPAAIRDVHLDYFRAGARVAVTASYQVSRSGFVASGMTAKAADDALRRSVDLAREARELALAEGIAGPLLVAASVGPYGATLHDGSEYRGRYGVAHAQLVEFHAERIAVLADAGPDLLAVETVPDADEAAAILEALAGHPDVPAWLSYSAADERQTRAGQPFDEAVALAAGPSVVAVGVNCTDPRYVTGLVRTAVATTDLPVVVYPNAGGTWDAAAGEWHDRGTPVLPERLVREWVAAGVAGVGGCCGLGPAAVRGIAATLAAPSAA